MTRFSDRIAKGDIIEINGERHVVVAVVDDCTFTTRPDISAWRRLLLWLEGDK